MVTVGGTVSTVTVCITVVAVFPVVSDTLLDAGKLSFSERSALAPLLMFTSMITRFRDRRRVGVFDDIRAIDDCDRGGLTVHRQIANARRAADNEARRYRALVNEVARNRNLRWRPSEEVPG